MLNKELDSGAICGDVCFPASWTGAPVWGVATPNLPPLPPSHLIQHHRAGDGDIQRVAGSVHRDGDGCVAL